MLDSRARKYVQPLFAVIAKLFIKLHITPRMITVMALFLGLGSSVFFYYELSLPAIILLWFSGLLDALDGTVARMIGKTSPFGALLDIIFDRTVEISFIVAVALKLPESRMACIFLLCSIIFSFSIFLTVGAVVKNKKKEKFFYYQAGLAERTETFIIFTLVMFFPTFTTKLFYLFTAMIVFTGCQRLLEAYLHFGKEQQQLPNNL
ncbi:MAG: hypothetical protein PWQ96_1940 [Clostridia bacterium]|nr:CDP-alcohol phosphatidyltransferase [Clostridiales bacterium]MDK2986296.1 hypothetical protein [Clostridia bacterium]